MIGNPQPNDLVEREGRDRVLREAHALFLELGFAEVSMQQIANAAGMTKASLYYHFRNKEDLFAQVARHEITRYFGGAIADLEGVESFQEQLERFAKFAFRAIRSDFSRLMDDFKRHVSIECQERMRMESGEFDPIQLLRPYFDRAKSAGELRDIDVDVAVALYFAMVGGLIMFSQHTTNIELSDDLATTMVDAYLNGLRAQPRS